MQDCVVHSSVSCENCLLLPKQKRCLRLQIDLQGLYKYSRFGQIWPNNSRQKPGLQSCELPAAIDNSSAVRQRRQGKLISVSISQTNIIKSNITLWLSRFKFYVYCSVWSSKRLALVAFNSLSAKCGIADVFDTVTGVLLVSGEFLVKILMHMYCIGIVKCVWYFASIFWFCYVSAIIYDHNLRRLHRRHYRMQTWSVFNQWRSTQQGSSLGKPSFWCRGILAHVLPRKNGAWLMQ